MQRVIATLLIPMLLSGCPAPSRTGESGEEVGPPRGWLSFCARNEDYPGCKEVVKQ